MGLFWHLTFCRETFQYRHIITGSFWHGDFSALWTFQYRTFCLRHGDFLALGYFCTGTLRHGDITPLGNFGTIQSNMDISAQTFWHLCRNMLLCQNVCFAEIIYLLKLNVPVPKCPCLKRSPCQNIQVLKCPCPEKSLCRKVHLPNSLVAKMSLEMNCPGAKMSWR